MVSWDLEQLSPPPLLRLRQLDLIRLRPASSLQCSLTFPCSSAHSHFLQKRPLRLCGNVIPGGGFRVFKPPKLTGCGP